MIAVTQNGNGTFTATQDGAAIAGIAAEGDTFMVSPVAGIDMPEGVFGTLDAAKDYIAVSVGDRIQAPRSAKPKQSKPKAERKVAAPKVAAPKESKPKAERNVSPVMARNLAALAEGQFPVYIASAEHADTIRAQRSLKPLLDNAMRSSKGLNIYPTPAEAKRIAKLLAGTDVAAQCEAGGWANWRKSLRARKPVVVEEAKA